MPKNREAVRRSIGLLAASCTALQSLGLVNQLLMAWSEGAAGLSLSLFTFSATGMALWATWAYMRPDRPEFLILLPNASGAIVAFAICATILADRHAPKGTNELEQANAMSLLASEVVSSDTNIGGKREQPHKAEFDAPLDDVQHRATEEMTRVPETPPAVQSPSVTAPSFQSVMERTARKTRTNAPDDRPDSSLAAENRRRNVAPFDCSSDRRSHFHSCEFAAYFNERKIENDYDAERSHRRSPPCDERDA